MSRIASRCCAALLLLFGLAALSASGDSTENDAESVARLAGAAGGPGFFDGTGAFVRFSFPSGVAAIGTDLFVADNNNHVIRRIDTTTGAVSTLAGSFGVAGSADGTGSAARFNSPTGIVASGTILFVCDTGNHTIRRIVSSNGAVTTLAGSAGSPGFVDNTLVTLVRFNGPRGIALGDGQILYVADTGNHAIRRVTFAGTTTTYAGSGTSGANEGVGAAASFSSPEGVAFLSPDVYVADTANHTIRRITPSGDVGSVTTFAGAAGSAGFLDNTAGLLARFSFPSSLTAIRADLLIADTGNHVVRRIDAPGGTNVTTLAGGPPLAPAPGFADGTGAAARFNGPKGVGTDGASIFVADTQNHAVRKVTLGGTATTVAGNPPQAGTTDAIGTAARFRAPAGIAVAGGDLFVADTGNHTIRKITSAGEVTTLAGNPGLSGILDGSGTAARFTAPQGIVAVGTDLYVADSGNHAIRKVSAAGAVTTFAGSAAGVPGFVNGTGTAASFRTPKGIATDGSFLFVADTGNHAVRKISIATGVVITLAGTGTAGYANTAPATFNGPEGAAVIGINLYVADTGNHAIRRIANFNVVSPVVTTFAGAGPPTPIPGFVNNSGSSARFSFPRGIAAVGSILYVADTGNHAIRAVSTATTVSTFLGAPDAATTRDGDASQALLNAPVGIAGVEGTIYFTDVNENVVRKILF